MKKCFGIVSWFPDKEPGRSQRQERINRLFGQLNNFWPEVDILVIAQNWKDFKPIETKNKQVIKYYNQLGILGARKTLRTEFLGCDYDYIIMFDDDAIIECTPEIATAYMTEIDKHQNGFCFIRGGHNKYHPYKSAQLNLCAISRFIYEKEPMVNIDPQKNEGYEDSIYACLLHHKYSKYEFIAPTGITHIQWLNKAETAPSTWTNKSDIKYNLIWQNTAKIEQYIVNHKELPLLDIFLKYGEFLPRNASHEQIKNAIIRYNRKNDKYIGGKNSYLYF